ncbi:MAG: FeoA family protein [Planctomycetia bacterium]|nr:FeoA family protein [Planctomycetia bacterium]
MSLAKIASGQKVRIVSMNAGRQLTEKLASIGIFPGSQVEVVQNHLHGAFLIDCRGSRFAIGRGLAHIIRVDD